MTTTSWSPLTVNPSESPPKHAHFSKIRQSRLNPASFSSMKRTMLLARPDQVLVSNRHRSTKLRCSDLWSKKMKKQVVRVLLAKHDPRVDKFHWRTKEIKDWKPLEGGRVSSRIAQYLERVRSQDRPRSVLPSSISQPCASDSHLRACERLKSDLHTQIRTLKADRSFNKSFHQSFYREEETDLTDFIRDEVDDFKRKTQVGMDMARKSSMTSLAKRMNKLGLSFYAAQRRRDKN